jgi:hypothetical protein
MDLIREHNDQAIEPLQAKETLRRLLRTADGSRVEVFHVPGVKHLVFTVHLTEVATGSDHERVSLRCSSI